MKALVLHGIRDLRVEEAPTQRLQDNSPTENVVAMYKAAREFGIYGT